MINIISNQGNANQNKSDIVPHSQYHDFKKDCQLHVLARIGETDPS